MNVHVKYFDSNRKYMNLLVHDEELLKKYNEILDRASQIMNQCLMKNILKLE